MSKSIKLKDNNYWDSESILHNVGGNYSPVKLKNFLPQGSGTPGFYSTQYLQLGYIDCMLAQNSNWSTLTLLVSSTFYGVQHTSNHILTIAQAGNVTANYLKLGGNGRGFYYNVDNTNKRIYIYAYVTGGNGFGNWVVTLLSKWQCNWTTEIVDNITKTDSWVEIPVVS